MRWLQFGAFSPIMRYGKYYPTGNLANERGEWGTLMEEGTITPPWLSVGVCHYLYVPPVMAVAARGLVYADMCAQSRTIPS